MTREDFLGTVFATTQAHLQQQALAGILRDGHAAAEALATPAARTLAHLQHVLRCKDFITLLATPQGMSTVQQAGLNVCAAGPAQGAPEAQAPDPMVLLARQLLLVQGGGNQLLSLIKKVRYQYRHRVHRRDLGDELCGVYPFRDADHEQVLVRSAESLSAPAKTGTRYPYADVEPFTCPRAKKKTRAALYQSRLQVRTMTAADLKTPDEQALIGQRGVFARQPIPAGVCVGVYGGQILDKGDLFILQDDRYLINASADPGQLGINGEHMMSLMNSLFPSDTQDTAAGHANTGYNVEAACFSARMSDDRPMLLHAFFSTTDIAPGDELRWNYDLSKANA